MEFYFVYQGKKCVGKMAVFDNRMTAVGTISGVFVYPDETTARQHVSKSNGGGVEFRWSMSDDPWILRGFNDCREDIKRGTAMGQDDVPVVPTRIGIAEEDMEHWRQGYLHCLRHVENGGSIG